VVGGVEEEEGEIWVLRPRAARVVVAGGDGGNEM
jgi:hypothetical protein